MSNAQTVCRLGLATNRAPSQHHTGTNRHGMQDKPDGIAGNSQDGHGIRLVVVPRIESQICI